MKNQIVQFIKKQLQELANPTIAQEMAAYMKTTMLFYGVRAQERRSIAKLACKKYPFQNQTEYIKVVQELWNQSHREEKYIAIDIARAYPHYINLESLSLFEQMIRQGAWWDFVDDIAINLIGPILLCSESAVWPIIERWVNDSDLWIRRTAIICQNKFKRKTNQKNLFSFCLQRAHEKDFFIKKAIGWALREYAKTNSQKVLIFVQDNKQKFSWLSYKEAIKRLK